MGWWKADPVSDQAPAHPSLPSSIPSSPPSSEASSCPVDPKTRSIWLQQAQSRAQSQPQPTPKLPADHPPLPSQPNPSTSPLPGSSLECSSDRISQSPHPTTQPKSHTPPRPLSTEREISSIPRSLPSSTSSTTSYSIPANAETPSTPHPSGNWIYPSESQFYNAVLSKNTASSPSALLSSISHIIPIHNAVNERAWTLIRGWEGNTSNTCGGPKLHSFSGKGAGALSPKAKWNSWVLGYQEPFDRHDWVVERCGGERVEYVIDFYQGKADSEQRQRGGRDDGKLNFYLDVRPKLNCWEGWKMRGERTMGWR